VKQAPACRQPRPSTLPTGALILLLLLPTGVLSQTIVTGAISGTVLDPSGALCPRPL